MATHCFPGLGRSRSFPSGEDMKFEAQRLRTFRDWPAYDQARPLLLAKAGFFYTGTDDVVQCFSCHCTIGSWMNNMRPGNVHFEINPACSFCLDQECGNVPFYVPGDAEYREIQRKLRQQCRGPEQHEASEHYHWKVTRVNHGLQCIGKNLSNRMDSFDTDWPFDCPVLPQDLAQAGFFYTGTADCVRCAFCQGVLRNWEEGDIPMVKHLTNYPRCRFVLGLDVENSCDVSQCTVGTESRTAHNRNQTACDVPKHPQYCSEIVRLCSFRDWPTSKHQNPRDLAIAGFFYAGSRDCVWCFFCGGGFRNWQKGDDPHTEHRRYYPQCPFIVALNDEIRYITNRGGFIRRYDGTPSLPVNCSEYALFPEYEDLDRRVESLLGNSNSDRTNPYQLAVAGFFSDSATDLMRCFCCGMVMMNVDGEDSFGDHEIGSPSCHYITRLADVFPILGLIPQHDLTKDQMLRILHKATEPISHHHTDRNQCMKTSSETPFEENKRLREQSQCKICHIEPVGVVFIPCGHLVSCVPCSAFCSHCPFCREQTWACVKVFWE